MMHTLSPDTSAVLNGPPKSVEAWTPRSQWRDDALRLLIEQQQALLGRLEHLTALLEPVAAYCLGDGVVPAERITQWVSEHPELADLVARHFHDEEEEDHD